MAKKKCVKCGGEVLPDDEGLCMKYIDMEMTDFLCRSCLAERLGTTVEALDRMVMRFRHRGCQLFTPLDE